MVLEKSVKIKHSRQKLSDKAIAQIKKAKVMRAVDIYELAVKYDVSPSTIYRVRGSK